MAARGIFTVGYRGAGELPLEIYEALRSLPLSRDIRPKIKFHITFEGIVTQNFATRQEGIEESRKYIGSPSAFYSVVIERFLTLERLPEEPEKSFFARLVSLLG